MTEGGNALLCVVGQSIIRNQELDLRVRLPQYALDRFSALRL